MSKVTAQFDQNGNPLVGIGKTVMISKRRAVINEASSDPSRTVPYEVSVPSVGKFFVSNWGDDNDYPGMLYDDYIMKSTVLRAAIDTKAEVLIGQGVYPVILSDYDSKGNEILSISKDIESRKLCKSRNIFRYLDAAAHSTFSSGMVYVELIMDVAHEKITGLDVKKSRDCRLTKMNDKGVIEYCIISGKWPTLPADGEYVAIPVLDSYDPIGDLRTRTVKSKSYILPIRLYEDNFYYYSVPPWDTARQSGWLDLVINVPTFLKNMFSNQMTLKYHIQIPYAYWDKKYPQNQYKDAKARMDLIQADMDDIETYLTGTSNAMKTLFTHFEVNASGKAEEQWKIETLDDKFKNEMYLPHSAAGNSEILFSMKINPSQMGAGMPGGPYSGNAGSGSDIREAFLINVAMCWPDRQRILDPIKIMHEFNGYDPETEYRFRDTILTTLDTGGGTQKILS